MFLVQLVVNGRQSVTVIMTAIHNTTLSCMQYQNYLLCNVYSKIVSLCQIWKIMLKFKNNFFFFFFFLLRWMSHVILKDRKPSKGLATRLLGQGCGIGCQSQQRMLTLKQVLCCFGCFAVVVSSYVFLFTHKCFNLLILFFL